MMAYCECAFEDIHRKQLLFVISPIVHRYQSISTESNAFKSKLATLVGPLLLLKALGFQKGEGEDEGKLKFEG